MNAADVLVALADHIGAANGIHGADLVRKITRSPEPDPAGERRVRVLVTELRLQGHHICAAPAGGYYIAETAEELDATCEFLYVRAMTTLTQISRMKGIALPDLRGQLHLPT